MGMQMIMLIDGQTGYLSKISLTDLKQALDQLSGDPSARSANDDPVGCG